MENESMDCVHMFKNYQISLHLFIKVVSIGQFFTKCTTHWGMSICPPLYSIYFMCFVVLYMYLYFISNNTKIYSFSCNLFFYFLELSLFWYSGSLVYKFNSFQNPICMSKCLYINLNVPLRSNENSFNPAHTREIPPCPPFVPTVI